MPVEQDRRAYGAHFGPTTGDRIRLADSDLWLEVEEDRNVYGEEARFGGGKVVRDGMGQGVARDTPDVVITNVVVLDYWGVVKADAPVIEHDHVGNDHVGCVAGHALTHA